MADTRNGGFLELMGADWQPAPPGIYGGDRKSLDVHMHMMEALTTFYEMTGHPTHRRRLLESIDLILTRMLRPDGTGYVQFTMDFEPLPAILFAVSWGRDARPADGVARPLNMTSPGHNVEFAWLLLHAADILGIPRQTYAGLIRRITEHCVRIGHRPRVRRRVCRHPCRCAGKPIRKTVLAAGRGPGRDARRVRACSARSSTGARFATSTISFSAEW